MEPNLKNFHPFGCPSYVLEGPLQSAKGMFPKWIERSCVRIFLGFSPNHASSIAYILNTQTGTVSPQFHVIYDDTFETARRDKHFESLWQAKARLQEEEKDKESTELREFTGRKQRKQLPSHKDSVIPPQMGLTSRLLNKRP